MFRKHCENCEDNKNKKYCFLCSVIHNAHDRVRPLLESYHLNEFDIMVGSFEQLLKLQKETAYRKGYVSAHLEQIGCFMDLNKKLAGKERQ